LRHYPFSRQVSGIIGVTTRVSGGILLKWAINNRLGGRGMD